MKNLFNRLFNWRDHPSGIFWLLGAFGLIVFIALGSLAVFGLVVNDSYVFFWVLLIGMLVFMLLMSPFVTIYNNAKTIQAFKKLIAEEEAKKEKQATG